MLQLLLKCDSELDEWKSPLAWMKPTILKLKHQLNKSTTQVKLAVCSHSELPCIYMTKSQGLWASPTGRGTELMKSQSGLHVRTTWGL